MPNWCYNEVSLYIKDSAKDRGLKVLQAFTQENPFQAIRPCPQALLETTSGFLGKGTPEQAELERRSAANRAEYGYANWYDWCCGNWGTKWDVDPALLDPIQRIGDVWFTKVSFDSAWCPPDELYQFISENYPDVELEAYWEEPGIGQKGTFSSYEGMLSSTIEDFTWDEEGEMFDIPDTAATPNVGAATVLPLPGGNTK